MSQRLQEGLPRKPERERIEERVLSPPVVNLNCWSFDGKSYIRSYVALTSLKYDFLVGNAWPPYTTSVFYGRATKMATILADSIGWLVPGQ